MKTAHDYAQQALRFAERSFGDEGVDELRRRCAETWQHGYDAKRSGDKRTADADESARLEAVDAARQARLSRKRWCTEHAAMCRMFAHAASWYAGYAAGVTD